MTRSAVTALISPAASSADRIAERRGPARIPEGPGGAVDGTPVATAIGVWVIRGLSLSAFFLLLLSSPLGAAPVKVRFLEGVTHGFLVLRSTAGQIVAHGDLLQTTHPDRVESRMVFRFKDGSIYDERVTFSQQHVFTLLLYRLVQQGPSFPEPMDVSLDRKHGRYQVKSVQKGREKSTGGELELPADTYNGMIVMLLKNLPRGGSESVHYVAFTPTPRLIKLDLVPAGNEPVRIGEQHGEGARYAIKPKLGMVIGLVAMLLGKKPPDYECLIWAKDIPAFVRCGGPLRLEGPVYRIELTSPR